MGIANNGVADEAKEARTFKPVIQNITDSRYTLRDVLTVLFHEKRLITLSCVLVILLGLAISFVMGDSYTAESRLLVLPNQDYVLDVGGKNQLFPMNEKQFVNSEIEFLKNPLLFARAIETVGMSRLYPNIADQRGNTWREWVEETFRKLTGSEEVSKEKLAAKAEQRRVNNAIENVRGNIKIIPVTDANVIHLTFVHRNPQLAAEYLNALLVVYQAHRSSVFSQSRATAFVEQRDKYIARLAEIEKRIEAFKDKYNISAFPDQKSLLVRQLAELQNNRLETENQLEQSRGRRLRLQGDFSDVPEAVPLYSEDNNFDAMDTGRSSMVSLQLRRSELLTKFNDDSRYVKDIESQIKNLGEIIAAAPSKKADSKRQGRNSVYDNVKLEVIRANADVASLEKRRGQIQDGLSSVERRLRDYDGSEREFNEIMLERTLVENNVKTYWQKVEEALILEELDRQKSANLRVIQPATPPLKNNNPFTLVFGISLVMGVVIAFGLALLVDFFREDMISPESAQRALGLPVLIAIPSIPSLIDLRPPAHQGKMTVFQRIARFLYGKRR